MSASKRSSESAKCEPRLSRAKAWISSTITVRTERSICRPPSLVSKMYTDSGVVTKIWGGRLLLAARLFAEVSPVRTETRSSGKLGSCARISASGASRFF